MSENQAQDQAQEQEHLEEQVAEEQARQNSGEEPQSLSIKWKGEDVELELGEAKELISKGYDYTRKTQALAEERKEWENSHKKDLEEFQRFDEWLQANPDKAERINAIIAGQETKDKDNRTAADPFDSEDWSTDSDGTDNGLAKQLQAYLEPLVKEVKDLRRERDDERETKERAKQQEEMQSLSDKIRGRIADSRVLSKMPETAYRSVVALMAEHGTTDPALAIKYVEAEQAKALEVLRKEYLDTKRDDSERFATDSASGGVPPTQPAWQPKRGNLRNGATARAVTEMLRRSNEE